MTLGLSITMANAARRSPAQVYTDQVRAVAPASQLGYYPLSEPSGTAILDRSGNGRSGAYKAAGEPLLGQSGSGDGLTAPLFDASNDYGNLAASGLLPVLNGAEGAIALWVNANVDASRYAFFLSADASNQIYIRKQATANQFICTHLGGGTGKTAVLALTLNAWYHLVWSWSAAAGQALVWVNGEPGASPSGRPGHVCGHADGVCDRRQQRGRRLGVGWQARAPGAVVNAAQGRRRGAAGAQGRPGAV
jgi:hypothetical protein